ncbi:MAG: ABC transporter ATP-binding protein [Planctomycetes bacterium]|nr:ABC transporter ATP-binding protein [Planctomycetota bacterium]
MLRGSGTHLGGAANVIEIESLTKRYGDAVAVDDLSLCAKPGEITGLLGPNGAGKSSTIACVSGLRAPDAGRVRVLGHDVHHERRRALEQLGVVPQELALYDELSARENLEYWGAAYGLRGRVLRERAAAVLEQLGLAERADERITSFSGGMQRRLNFGCALLHTPRVLVLDEPTVGVDPQSRVRLLELVRQAADAGAAVLYTTHQMQEAEELCDRLAIVDHGKLIAFGTLPELQSRLGGRDILGLSGRFDPPSARAALEGLRETLGDFALNTLDAHALQLAVRDGARVLAQVLAALEAAGNEVREASLRQPSLESLFLALTGKELRE